MGKLKLPLLVVLLSVGLVLMLQNTAPVETRLLLLTIAMPQAVLIFITMLVGFLAGVFATLYFLREKNAPTRKDL